jgi:hypothetical protein
MESNTLMNGYQILTVNKDIKSHALNYSSKNYSNNHLIFFFL